MFVRAAWCVLLSILAAAVGATASFDDAPSDPAARAAVLDAEATALLRAGRPAEAAERFAAALALDDGTVRLTWFRPDEPAPAWTAAIGPGLGRHRRAAEAALAAGDAARAAAWGEVADRLTAPPPAGPDSSAALTARPWRIRLPPIDYDVMQGGRGRVGGASARVTLIDFWASWCAPCVEELPHLVALGDRWSDAGLDLVLVNVRESRDVALPFLRSLGVEAPIAAYNPAFDAAIQADTLPTLVLVDRDGGLRGRWNGYRSGLVAELEPIIEHVLADIDVAREPVASVAIGDGSFELDWYREVSGRIEDVAALPSADGTTGVIASLGRRLALYGADGRTARTIEGVPMSTAIVPAPPGDAATSAVLGFRPGADRLVVVDLATGASTVVDAGGAVLDVAAVDPPATRLLLAGIDGLRVREGDGVRHLSGGTVSDVEPSGTGFRLLEAGRRTLRLAAVDASASPERDVPADAWRLVAAPGGFGTLPAGVSDATSGRFVGGRGPLLAAVTADGTLAVLRPEDGEVVFRATWPGLAHLAAVDVDGDGLDELAVATGDHIGLLRGVPSGRDDRAPLDAPDARR